MPQTELSYCPKCRTRKPAHRVGQLLKCTGCLCWHDDAPDEGGDYDDRNPSARLERQERQRLRRSR